MTTGGKARRPIRETPFWQAYGRWRYAILFYALLLTLLILPITLTFGLPGLLIKLLIGVCLLAAVMPNATKRTRQALFLGGLLLAASQFLPEQGQVSTRPAYVLALIGLTGLAAAAGALRFAVTAPQVNSESIHAALSAYLLAGIFFGQIFLSIESIHPGSIVGPDRFSEFNAIYFSFVTLATLGYGDFLPRTAISRGVATFEVIGGQLYLAVLVARLIGLFASDRR
jgi:voltage-gated potassium channel